MAMHNVQHSLEAQELLFTKQHGILFKLCVAKLWTKVFRLTMISS
jgi:hypothetical protein